MSEQHLHSEARSRAHGPWKGRAVLAGMLLAGVLSACGGGGGGGGSTAASSWSEQAYVKAANAGQGDQFGSSIAIDGDTLVVGASEEDSNQTTITNGSGASSDDSASAAGAVYVYVRSGGVWSEQAYLKAPNAVAGANFGLSVAISGDTLVVGTDSDASAQATITNGSTASSDTSASGAGAAYVFVRSGSTWSQQAYLKAPNAAADYLFGHSVAIDGDTIVVGSNGESNSQQTVTNGATVSDDGNASGSGAAYVFTRSGTSWSQQAYLKADNATTDYNFGGSVGISGDTIVVGSDAENGSSTFYSGAAYVFVRSGTQWSQQSSLKASNAGNGDNFGYSAAIDGDTIVVGARKEDSGQASVTNGSGASSDDSAAEAGAAYVFVRSGTSWSEQAYLKAANADAGDNFGTSVAISGDLITVGAYLERSGQTTITNGAMASADNSAGGAGAAYVFARSGTSWSQQAYLKAANAETGNQFGTGVAVSGSTVAVGAPGESNSQTTIINGSTASSDGQAPGAGAAYVFKYGS